MSQVNMRANSSDEKNNAQNPNKNVEIGNIHTIKQCALWDNQNHKTTKLKFIYSNLEQVTENRSEVLSSASLRYLQRILVNYAANKCKNSPINSKEMQEDIAFLGISDAIKCELNDSENLEIKSIVEAKLRENIHDFIIR